MHQYLEHEHDNEWNKHETPDKKGEIADILKDQGEVMKNQVIERVKRMAEYYYGTDKERNYAKDLENDDATSEEYDDSTNTEHLYTIMKYQGKDILVHIGTGEFALEIFTRRNIPKLRGFSHSPLPLFVVTAWADEEYKEQNPKKFLDKHTMIYSPKGGQAELRISHKQRESSIDYGKSNGIMQYEDAVLALQNAEIYKTFHSATDFAKFSHKMKELKTYTPEKIQIRITMKEEFLSNDISDKDFSTTLGSCLCNLADKNQENIYMLVQSFDTHKEMFTKQTTF